MKTKDQILKELDLKEIRQFYVVSRKKMGCYNCGQPTWRGSLCDYCTTAKIEKQFAARVRA